MTENSRGAWGNQIQFVLTCIGFSVGLGNLWRFPAMAYENGGAAFLIPYVTCSILVGLPCLYLEFFIGQSTQSGPSKAFWYYMPALQGIGWAMSLLSLLTGIYYNLVVAWCLRYIFDVITFQSSKWTSCDNYWNSETCQGINGSVAAIGDNATFAAQEFFRKVADKYSDLKVEFLLIIDPECRAIYPIKQYKMTGKMARFLGQKRISTKQRIRVGLEYRLFKMSATPEEYGMFNWEMFTALLMAWIITCLSIIKGVSVIGKISFLTATLPYVIIVIMFIRGVTMDGAKAGIDYYLLKPDMSKVFRLKTWVEAAKQLCFSLSIGFGGLLALASFNKKDHNCFRDAIVVTICDCLMSIIGGVAVFSTLGSLSKSSGKPIDDLFKYDAPSITFVTYPQAISTMPVPELFALLLFFMFFLLGISSQFGTTQTIVTTVTDQFPALRRWKWAVAVGLCIFCLLVGLLMCWQSGFYWFQLFFNSIGGITVLILCLVEVVSIIYLYGRSNIIRDIRKNLGYPKSRLTKIFGASGYYILLCWTVLTPFILMVVVVTGIVADFCSATNKDRNLFLTYLPLLLIPGLTFINIWYFVRKGKSWKQAFIIRSQLPSIETRAKEVRITPATLMPNDKIFAFN
ncbi:unnamed protein product [Haemonchus placei]|uniref:Transporter n=1 Tax=Haemonchus placei TaxID=6290 RepID=A0A0N4WJ87_HAEPC|nr:unnamed protein product [Haemonchus placei]